MKYWIVVFALAATASAAEHDWRIVGGTTAEEGQFPYQVSLRNWGYHFCGGTIYNSKYIITAAHCLVNFPGDIEGYGLTALVGTNNLNPNSEVDGDKYEVEKIIWHELFPSTMPLNDIGLVKVKRDIVFGPKIQHIGFYTQNITPGSTIILSGWGQTSTTGNLADKLLYLNTTVMDLEECQGKISNLDNTQLCSFSGKGEGNCVGDSGGPLVADNRLVAVVSRRYGPCGGGYPDVNTKIKSHVDWLWATMARN